MTTLPIERDLTGLSRRGLTLTSRLAAALVTFPLVALILGLIVFNYVHWGTERTIFISAVLGPFAAFNLLLGFHSVFVDRAPGATWIRIDEEALRLGWPNGHVDTYRWRSWRTHFRISTYLESPTAWSPTPTLVEAFWRPPSAIPDDLVPTVVNLIEHSSLNVKTYTATARRGRKVLRREVRGSHQARVDLGAP